MNYILTFIFTKKLKLKIFNKQKERKCLIIGAEKDKQVKTLKY